MLGEILGRGRWEGFEGGRGCNIHTSSEETVFRENSDGVDEQDCD